MLWQRTQAARGDWLVSWGGQPDKRADPVGRSRLQPEVSGPVFTYRSHPILPGVLSRAALRAGMDAQFPRSYVRPGQPRRCGSPSCRPRSSATRRIERTARRSHPAPAAHLPAPRTVSPSARRTPTALRRTRPVRPLRRGRRRPLRRRQNEADVRVTVGSRTSATRATSSDYTGQLQVRSVVRITDGSGTTGPDTTSPRPFPAPRRRAARSAQAARSPPPSTRSSRAP